MQFNDWESRLYFTVCADTNGHLALDREIGVRIILQLVVFGARAISIDGLITPGLSDSAVPIFPTSPTQVSS
jgi:hypothetical protein